MDHIGYASGKQRWNGIADLFGNFDLRTSELKIVRKGLKTCRFSVRDRPVLLRVEITPLFRFKKLGSNGESGSVPPKPAKQIRTPLRLSMPTIRCEFRGNPL